MDIEEELKVIFNVNSICDLCMLDSPSGCAGLYNEPCLKDVFGLLKEKHINKIKEFAERIKQ